MPKPRPPYLEGHYYHFYNRGRSRLSIFHNHRDYLYLQQHLLSYAVEFQVTVIAYCLVPNHYHFLVRQDGSQKASLLIQRLFNRYSKTYNKKYAHSGTIFEGPYQVIPVEDEEYLRHLCRYIHGNPVKHGLVKKPVDWPYGNYHEWLGLRDGALVDRQFIEDFFPAPGEYEAFVKDLIKKWDLPKGLSDAEY